MKILIVRHAIAEERNPYSLPKRSDSERALTPQGRVKMERAAHGLYRLVHHIDIIAHSPLVRAKQTADILNVCYPKANLMEIEQLEPGTNAEDVGDWLDLVTRGDVVALVGHEPDLSYLLGWLTTGREESFIRLKKGSAVLLECNVKLGPGAADIQWMLTPKQLRTLAV